jgi:hypothetical protein
MSVDRHGTHGVLGFTPAEHWVAETTRPELELLASLPAPKGTFLPTFVGTVSRYDGPIADVTPALVRGYRESLGHPFVIDVSPWRAGPEGTEGRRIDYTHVTADAVTVRGYDFAFVEAGWAVTLTGTCTAAQAPVFAAAFEEMAAGVRILTPAGATEAYPSALAQERLLEISPLDAFASAHAGADREDLTALPVNTPAMPDGMWLSAAAVEQLQQVALGARTGGRLGVRPEGLDELEEAELLDGGRPGPAMDRVMDIWRAPRIGVKITGQLGVASTQFQAWSDGTEAIVAAAPGYGVLLDGMTEGVPSAEKVRLGVIPLLSLSTAIARWTGIRPAWNLRTTPESVDQGLLMERFSGSGHPPAGADEAMLRMWQQPWFAWNMASTGIDREVEDGHLYINAGPAGSYGVYTAAASTTSDVVPLTGAYLFDVIEEMVQSCLYGRRRLI